MFIRLGGTRKAVSTTFVAVHMSGYVKVFGCRPLKNLSTRTGAGGPKTSNGRNRESGR